jgi:hypothetical protein
VSVCLACDVRPWKRWLRWRQSRVACRCHLDPSLSLSKPADCSEQEIARTAGCVFAFFGCLHEAAGAAGGSRMMTSLVSSDMSYRRVSIAALARRHSRPAAL